MAQEVFPPGLDLQTLEKLRIYYAQLNSLHTLEVNNSYQQLKWVEDLITKAKASNSTLESSNSPVTTKEVSRRRKRRRKPQPQEHEQPRGVDRLPPSARLSKHKHLRKAINECFEAHPYQDMSVGSVIDWFYSPEEREWNETTTKTIQEVFHYSLAREGSPHTKSWISIQPGVYRLKDSIAIAQESKKNEA